MKSTRQQYHQQIAQTLAERFPETAENQPELLAYHLTESGLYDEAVGYWQKAGEKSVQRSAHMEAIEHLTKGLEILHRLLTTPERVLQELNVQITLGETLMAVKGYAASEVEHVYIRAQELCQQVGEASQICNALGGLWNFYLVRGKLQMAHALAEQHLSLAQCASEPLSLEAVYYLIWSHHMLGMTCYYLGDFVSAREHLEQSLALLPPQAYDAAGFTLAVPQVSCQVFTALPLWQLGYAEQALRACQHALSLAERLSHPYSLAYALYFTCTVHQLRREVQPTHERAEAVMLLSKDQEFRFWLGLGMVLGGWALSMQGRGEQGATQIRQGMTTRQAMGAALGQPWSLAGCEGAPR